ncbi:MAG: hypothetical protein NC548_54670 [Lachnospiraceae bacterium]|nr:hypothetical protein [Lachnospiraceae bacterium]
MNNLKEKVELNNIKNVEFLIEYAKENINNVRNMPEFIKILLKVCPDFKNNNCSNKNKIILTIGKNRNTSFKRLLTAVCHNPIVLPFDTSNNEKLFVPAIHIKECEEDTNIITIFFDNLSNIEIEDFSAIINNTERYKISFKYNNADYILDLRINN